MQSRRTGLVESTNVKSGIDSTRLVSVKQWEDETARDEILIEEESGEHLKTRHSRNLGLHVGT